MLKTLYVNNFGLSRRTRIRATTKKTETHTHPFSISRRRCLFFISSKKQRQLSTKFNSNCEFLYGNYIFSNGN